MEDAFQYTLHRLVQAEPMQAFVLCPVDAALAFEILADQRTPLAEQLRAARDANEVRERLLASVAAGGERHRRRLAAV